MSLAKLSIVPGAMTLKSLDSALRKVQHRMNCVESEVNRLAGTKEGVPVEVIAEFHVLRGKIQLLKMADIVLSLQRGKKAVDIAKTYGVTPARISQIKAMYLKKPRPTRYRLVGGQCTRNEGLLLLWLNRGKN